MLSRVYYPVVHLLPNYLGSLRLDWLFWLTFRKSLTNALSYVGVDSEVSLIGAAVSLPMLLLYLFAVSEYLVSYSII
jgi:hypothetical protein